MHSVDSDYYTVQHVESFGDHNFGYERAIKSLAEESNALLDPHVSKTFVLGGFFPHNSTQVDFINFARDMHKTVDGISDRLILLDRNETPLLVAKSRNELLESNTILSHSRLKGEKVSQEIPQLVRADIKKLPFKNSVDFFFLDHTLTFIQDEDLPAVGESVSRALTDTGIVLVINHEPGVFSSISRKLEARRNKTTTYPRRNHKIIEGVQGFLKPSIIAVGDMGFAGDYSLIAFSKKESPYGAHEGPPFAYYRNLV